MDEKRKVVSSEHYFIGCMLSDYSFVINACNTVGFKVEYLSSSTARAAWNTAESLFAKGKSVDTASIVETMDVDCKHIDIETASSYLMRAKSVASDIHNLIYHMKLIKELYRKRHTIEIMSECIDLLSDNGDVDDVVSRAKHRLASMETEMAYVSESSEDKLCAMKKRYSDVRGAGTSGIKSRWSHLQGTLASYQFGKLTVIAARPKMGKSTLAFNEVVNTSYRNRIPTAVFSIEMDEEELLEKGGSDLTGMDNAKLKQGEYSDAEIEKFMSNGVKPLMEAPLFVIDNPSMTIEQICSRTRQLVAEKNIRFVVIDYLQIISSTPGSRFQSKTYEIAHWTNELRILAKETNAAIVILSQISRPPKGMDSNYDPLKAPMPTMNDLKDSGAIEQDAYAIILIGPSQSPTVVPSWHKVDPVCVRVEANRGAGTGDFECMFDKPHNRFMSFMQYEKYRKMTYSNQQKGIPSP